jgi:TonB family protein
MKKYFALAATVAAAIMIIQAQDVTFRAPATGQPQEVAGLPADAEATIRAAVSQKNPDLLEAAAAGYAKLHKYEAAQKMLESALAIRGDAAGTQSGSYATGLVKLGDLAAERRQFDQADTYYAQAIALGDRTEITPALLYMGIKAYRAQNYDAAQGFLERIVAIDPQGPKAGPALMWLGNIRQRGMFGWLGSADAEALYQRALGVEDPKSLDAVDTMRNYASLLRRMRRPEEADAMEARAREAQTGRNTAKAATVLPNDVYRIGPGIKPPSLLQKVEPQYTEEARAGKIQGTTVLTVEVWPDGFAHNAVVSRSLEPGLDQKAIDAVSQWQFKPAIKDGAPVKVVASIEINFRLQ